MVIESLYRIIVACTSLFHLIDGHFNDSNADTPKVISRCQSQAVEDVCRLTEHIFGPNLGAKVDRLLFLPRLMRFGITIACSTTSGPRAGCANTAYRDHGWNKALYYKLAKMSPCGINGYRRVRVPHHFPRGNNDKFITHNRMRVYYLLANAKKIALHRTAICSKHTWKIRSSPAWNMSVSGNLGYVLVQ